MILQGCLQDLELDGRSIGLPEVRETSGIKAGCVWTFPCLSEGSGVCDGATCVQSGTEGYECKCPEGGCGQGGRKVRYVFILFGK